MIIEFLKFIKSWIVPRHGVVNVTMVRRYKSNNNWIGELYVDGRMMGMTSDSILGPQEFKAILSMGYKDGQRVLKSLHVVIERGQFTEPQAIDTVRVGSNDPKENDKVLSKLIDMVQAKSDINFIVLYRPLVEC